MMKDFKYRDLLLTVLIYAILVFVVGYFKTEIIYDYLIANNDESFYKTVFHFGNITTTIIALIFLLLIIGLVWFTANAKKILTKSEYIYGSILVVIILILFEVVKFVYLLFDLENQLIEIPIDIYFIENIQRIDFAKYTTYISYISYFLSSIVFVVGLYYEKRKELIKLLGIGLVYLIYFSFLQFVF